MSAMVFGASACANRGIAVAAAAASEVFENWRQFMIIDFSSRNGCSTGSVDSDVSGDPVVGQAGRSHPVFTIPSSHKKPKQPVNDSRNPPCDCRVRPRPTVIASVAKQSVASARLSVDEVPKRSCSVCFRNFATSADGPRPNRRMGGGRTVDCFAALAMTGRAALLDNEAPRPPLAVHVKTAMAGNRKAAFLLACQVLWEDVQHGQTRDDRVRAFTASPCRRCSATARMGKYGHSNSTRFG